MDELLSADVETFRRAAEEDRAAASRARDRAVGLPADASFEDVLGAWDAIAHPLNRTRGLAHLFVQVHPDPALREAAAEAEQAFDALLTELSLDRPLYERLAALDPDAAPDDTARHVLRRALRDFRRAGVDRSPEDRDHIRRLRERLVELGQRFRRSIASDVREVLVDGAAELEGLPEDWIAAHPPGPDGRVRLTTDPPDLIPVLKFARRRSLRAALHRASMQRGVPDNLEVLDALLAARHDLACRLGHDHWADYVTEDKMIGSAERAARFVARVRELTAAGLERDQAELLRLLRAEEPAADGLRDYDRLHLIESLKRERFAVDARIVRGYFPYRSVRDGVLDTIERLYGVTVGPVAVATWHEDVEAYQIVEDGRPVARFLLDMHPRRDKFKHAAMFDLAAGRLGGELPCAVLACNMPRPSGDDPALLDPTEVKTLFHECGHLVHHLLASPHRYLATAGIATEWDFVEVPSQLFEEWTRDPGVVARFARHHETGEPIPAELVRRLEQADACGRAVDTRVQMMYAAVSLELHRRDPAGLDTTALVRELKARFVPFPYEEGTAFHASFGHLEGYSALYYTYMWSLVLAKDCLSVFGDNLMDRGVAERWRRRVLAPGGSRDAEDLLEDFLGRPFSFAAFESWLAA